MRAPAGLDIAILREPPPDWDDLLERIAAAEFFHTILWTQAVCRHVPGCRPLWLSARLDGRLVGGLAAVQRRHRWGQRLHSHHEGTSGGPLVADELPPAGQEEVFAALLARYAGLVRPPVLAATCVLPASAAERFGPLASGWGWRTTPLRAAWLPLEGGLEHTERYVFKKNRRNERNRALKRGCQAGVTRDPEILAAYYPIYLAAVRRWGAAATPRELLADLLADPADRAFLSYVRHAGEIIGGHVCFHRGGRVTAWNGATLPEHNDKFPATLLIWTDIVEACRRGAVVLDLGGSGGIATLESFKRLLGAREETRLHCLRAPAPLRWLAGWRRRHGRWGGP
jgi:CelD/BcsL family acetyltransferase involved in cellulose biosynthesis